MINWIKKLLGPSPLPISKMPTEIHGKNWPLIAEKKYDVLVKEGIRGDIWTEEFIKGGELLVPEGILKWCVTDKGWIRITLDEKN